MRLCQYRPDVTAAMIYDFAQRIPATLTFNARFNVLSRVACLLFVRLCRVPLPSPTFLLSIIQFFTTLLGPHPRCSTNSTPLHVAIVVMPHVTSPGPGERLGELAGRLYAAITWALDTSNFLQSTTTANHSRSTSTIVTRLSDHCPFRLPLCSHSCRLGPTPEKEWYYCMLLVAYNLLTLDFFPCLHNLIAPHLPPAMPP
jgi:hypothetical protein